MYTVSIIIFLNKKDKGLEYTRENIGSFLKEKKKKGADIHVKNIESFPKMKKTKSESVNILSNDILLNVILLKSFNFLWNYK